MDVAYKKFNTDEDLYRAIQRNDRSALNHLYETHFETVKYFIMQNSGDTDDAKDIFQEGVIALWTNIRDQSYELRPEASLSTYFLRICKYRWYEYLKSAGVQRTTPLEPGMDRPEDQTVYQELIKREEIQYLESLIAGLGEQCQKILRLFYYEEKNMESIAKTFDIQVNSAKNQKYRCMKRLKELHQTHSQKR